jgi:hypothetical protein
MLWILIFVSLFICSVTDIFLLKLH